MTRHPYRLWIVVLLLGWAFDYLFWKHSPGLNYAVFLAACLLAGSGLLLSLRLVPARKSLWLLLPIAFFTLVSFSREEPLTRGLGYALSLGSAGLLAVTYLSGRWLTFSLVDYVLGAIDLIASLIAGPVMHLQEAHRERTKQGQRLLPSQTGPVLRGLVIAAPVIVVFTTLLSSADLIFEQKVTDLLEQFGFEHMGENIARLLIGLACAYLLVGVFTHAALRSGGSPTRSRPVLPRFLGFIETAVVQGSVVALFLAFVIIQFRYLFGGETNIGATGFTYSQYARSGFNELVIVAGLSLLLTLGLSTITRREGERQRWIFSALSVTILALVLVMLVSAFQRLSIAIDWHGYSRLRLYPRVFMVWLGLLFVAVVVLEIRQRERFFALAALLAGLGFAATLSLMNVDASIVRYNVERARNGERFNVSYLTTLSVDAVPALVDEYRRSDLPVEHHEGIGAALLCYARSETVEPPFSDSDWRSMSLARLGAMRAYETLKGAFVNYQVNQEPGVIRVRTPVGEWYDCVMEAE